ncbi:hypothetical protein AB3X93_10600 [Paraburkholderia sp. BR14262]|uniref:hypothetical protein n=1 Tax=Paraburkholderia sp. BR14262 TaxID=3236999 RepID=UPI0034CDFB21
MVEQPFEPVALDPEHFGAHFQSPLIRPNNLNLENCSACFFSQGFVVILAVLFTGFETIQQSLKAPMARETFGALFFSVWTDTRNPYPCSIQHGTPKPQVGSNSFVSREAVLTRPGLQTAPFS